MNCIKDKSAGWIIEDETKKIACRYEWFKKFGIPKYISDIIT
jgi:hypothetical protein